MVLRLPEKFAGQPATKVAAYLDLDVDGVENAIRERAEQARQEAQDQAQHAAEQHAAAQQESAERVGQMKGAVDQAGHMVQRDRRARCPLRAK